MIFLTGGTGMLGSHLLLDLTRSGVKVHALKRKNSDLNIVRKIFSWYTSDPDLLFRQIEWVEGDLSDKDSLRKGMEGADAVVHAAAKISFNPGDHSAMLVENMEGTMILVDLALELNIPRFCHVSSIAALGSQDSGLPVDEAFSWKNDRHRSAYSESKFLSEMEVWRGVQVGLECVVVNPSVILGPGNWNSGSPRFFRTVAKGMKFYTSGSNGFVDVRDVSKAIIGLLFVQDWDSVKNQRYVISAENRPYREIFEMIAVALHRPIPGIRANRLLLQLGWRASWLVSRLTGANPDLTRETARTSQKIAAYDGSKITGTIDFSYTPIDQTIKDIGKIFLEDH
jgi:nucleoside-diphosphate-sugar epimerase